MAYAREERMECYTLGNGIKAEIERTSSGYYAVRITDAEGHICQDMYSTEAGALRAVLVYVENIVLTGAEEH